MKGGIDLPDVRHPRWPGRVEGRPARLPTRNVRPSTDRPCPTFAYAEPTGLCVVHEPGTPCLKGEFDGAFLRCAARGVWFALLPLARFAFARRYRLRGEARGVVPRRGRWVRVIVAATTVITTALVVSSDRWKTSHVH